MISFLPNWSSSDHAFVFGLAVVIVTLLYCCSTSSYGKWRKLNVPCLQPVPLFGNTFRMFTNQEHKSVTFDRIYRAFPDRKLCGFYQMKAPYLMVRDPQLINDIMVKDFSHFTDHGFETDPAVNIMANSLFLMNGQRWRTMRQKLSPGFTSGKLKLAHDQIKECSDELMGYIARKVDRHDRRVEVKELMEKYSTDVIGTCAFGLKLNTIKNDDSDFRSYGRKIFQSTVRVMLAQMLLILAPKVAKVLKIKQFPSDAAAFYQSAFAEVIEYRETNNIVRHDVAQTLIQARKDLVLNDDLALQDKYTETDIIANAIIMFTAGFEPVSATLAFCLYELALNKRVQDKLREEINSKKEKHGEFNNEFLLDLHYANMVLEETLRMYSLTVVIFREATQQYYVPDESLLIEKGQKIIIPMHSINHDEKYYPNPETFYPERFSTEEKLKRSNGTFFPFGEGPRMCIGKRFAELEMKLVLAEILSKFEVLPCEKTEIPLQIKNGIGLISPKNGIWLNFKSVMKK